VRFDVHANGHPRAIEARRDGRGWLVTVDGRTMAVDLTRAGDRWSLLIGPANAGRYTSKDVGAGFPGPSSVEGSRPVPMRSYDVAVEHRGRGERLVHVNGQVIVVSYANGRSRGGGHEAADGPVRIASPMPGRVVKVLVAPGDAVAARQGVAIVEAMKMENELRAPRAGTVREVTAREGSSVDAGTVLVVIA
jgi:biotin carboxyl carrier protein